MLRLESSFFTKPVVFIVAVTMYLLFWIIHPIMLLCASKHIRLASTMARKMGCSNKLNERYCSHQYFTIFQTCSKNFWWIFAFYYFCHFFLQNVGIVGYSRKNLTDEDLRSIIASTLTCRIDHRYGSHTVIQILFPTIQFLILNPWVSQITAPYNFRMQRAQMLEVAWMIEIHGWQLFICWLGFINLQP